MGKKKNKNAPAKQKALSAAEKAEKVTLARQKKDSDCSRAIAEAIDDLMAVRKAANFTAENAKAGIQEAVKKLQKLA